MLTGRLPGVLFALAVISGVTRAQPKPAKTVPRTEATSTIQAPKTVTVIPAAVPFSKTGDATTKFHATGTAGLKIDGSTEELSVTDNGKVLRIIVPLAKLSSGIDLRDKHMKEVVLEVATFPDAAFSALRSELKIPDNGRSVDGELSGTFNLHGVGKATRIKYTARNDGGTIYVLGSWTINLTDHDIPLQKLNYVGLKVDPVVSVTTSFFVKGN